MTTSQQTRSEALPLEEKTVADYLRNKVDGVPGVTGKIGFTAQGDREGVVVGNAVEPGE